jgi:hypothetical protein
LAAASGRSSNGTNSWRGTLAITSVTRRSSAARPRRPVRKIVWTAISATMCWRIAAKSGSVITVSGERDTHATPSRGAAGWRSAE